MTALMEGGPDAMYSLPEHPQQMTNQDKKNFVEAVERIVRSGAKAVDALTPEEEAQISAARVRYQEALVAANEALLVAGAMPEGDGPQQEAARRATLARRATMELKATETLATTCLALEKKGGAAMAARQHNAHLENVRAMARRLVAFGMRGTEEVTPTTPIGGTPKKFGGNSRLDSALGLATRDAYIRTSSGYAMRGMGSLGPEDRYMGEAEHALFGAGEEEDPGLGMEAPGSPLRRKLMSALEAVKTGTVESAAAQLSEGIRESMSAELAGARAKEGAIKWEPGEVMLIGVLIDYKEERTGLFAEEARDRVYGDKQELMEDLQMITACKNLTNLKRAVERVGRRMEQRAAALHALRTVEAMEQSWKLLLEAQGVRKEMERMQALARGLEDAGMSTEDAFEKTVNYRRDQLQRKGGVLLTEGAGMLNDKDLTIQQALARAPATQRGHKRQIEEINKQASAEAAQRKMELELAQAQQAQQQAEQQHLWQMQQLMQQHQQFVQHTQQQGPPPGFGGFRALPPGLCQPILPLPAPPVRPVPPPPVVPPWPPLGEIAPKVEEKGGKEWAGVRALKAGDMVPEGMARMAVQRRWRGIKDGRLVAENSCFRCGEIGADHEAKDCKAILD